MVKYNSYSDWRKDYVKSKKYKDYKKYLNGPIWKAKSYRWIKETDECESCKNPEKSNPGGQFTCHHKHYRSLGNEKREDVMVLCWRCHQSYHKKINWKDYQREHNKIKTMNHKDIKWIEVSRELQKLKK